MFSLKKGVKLSYQWFNIWLLKFVRFSWRHSVLTIIIFTGLSFFLAAQLSKVKIVFSAEDLAGQGLPTADELQDIKNRYADGVTSLFILTPPKNEKFFSLDQLCQIRKWYSFTRNSIPSLKSSLSTFDFKWPVRLSEDKIQYQNLLNLDCQGVQLNSDLQKIQQALNESPFGLAKDRKQNFNLIFQFTLKDSTTSRFGSFDPEVIGQIRESVQKELLPLIPGSQGHWIGPADYQWYVLEGFKFSKYINLGMIVLMLIGLRIFFGNWFCGFIFVSSLVVTSIWVFGFKGLMGSSFDVMSTGLILIIGISSMEDYIFVCYEQIRNSSWRKSIQRMLLPSFYTSLTTMVGFISLSVSDVEAIRKMGIWSAFGVAAEWLVLFVFFPCIFMQFKKFKSWITPHKATGLRWVQNIATEALPRSVSYASLLVYPLAVWAFYGINFNVAPHDVFPPEHEYSRGIEELRQTKGWTGVVSLLFDENTDEKEAEKIIDEIRSTSEGRKEIVTHESPLMISQWLAKAGSIQNDEAQIHFKSSRVYEQYVDKEERPRALFYIRDTSTIPVEDLKKKTSEICKNRCHLGGEIVAHSDFSNLVPKTLVDSLTSSLVIVGLIIGWLAAAQNKIKLVPSLLLSSFWGPLVMIMILGGLHSTLDFWKSIFASILVGLTGDNAIQYLFASKRQNIHKGIGERGGASILNNLLMATTALVYLGSYFNSPRAFGVILCVGLTMSLVGDLWLLNGLLPQSKKNIGNSLS